MNKTQKLIVGGVSAVALIGGGIFAYTQMGQTAETLFLSRLSENYAQKEIATNFTFSVDKFDVGDISYNGFDNVKISGSIHSSTEDFDFTLNSFEVAGFKTPKAHLIKANEDLYINAELIPTFLEFQTTSAGLSVDFSESSKVVEGKYFSVGDAIKELAGQEVYDEFEKVFKQSGEENAALKKEMEASYKTFLSNIDAKAFAKSGSDVTLTLGAEDIKKLVKTSFETIANSEHYEGDKDSIKSSIASLESSYEEALGKLDKLEVSLTLGEKPGDMSTKITIEGKVEGTTDAKIEAVVRYESEAIPYQKPTKPENMIGTSELNSVITDIYSKIYESSYSSYNY